MRDNNALHLTARARVRSLELTRFRECERSPDMGAAV